MASAPYTNDTRETLDTSTSITITYPLDINFTAGTYKHIKLEYGVILDDEIKVIKTINRPISSSINRLNLSASYSVQTKDIVRQNGGYSNDNTLTVGVRTTLTRKSGSESSSIRRSVVMDGEYSGASFHFATTRRNRALNQIDISRCNSQGKLDDTGQYILVGCQYVEDCFNDIDYGVPKNIISAYTLGFNGVDYTSWYAHWDASSGVSTSMVFPYELDATTDIAFITAYQVLYVGSASGTIYPLGIGTATSRSFPAADAITPFDIKGNNLGIAFGQKAKNDNFTCNFDADFLKSLSINGNPIVDFVTEQGEGNGWAYRVWYSGKRECWTKLSVSATLSTSNGGWYSNGTSGAATPDFPTLDNGTNLFTEEPMKFISAENISSTARNVLAGIYYGNVDHVTNFGNYVLFRGNSLSGSNKYNVYMRAIQFDDNIISTYDHPNGYSI